MRGLKQKMLLNISRVLITKSVDELKASSSAEKVLLWLGRKSEQGYVVDEVFTPIQIADEDFFRIPEEGMDELMNKLRSERKMIVAQIHTHPREAFHSLADDTWAIVRHIGAYSLVVPNFCAATDVSNFHETIATFVLDEFNSWEETDNSNIVIK